MTLSLKKSVIQITPRDNQDFKGDQEAIPKDNGYFIYCIVGARGRGKSTILLGLLNGYLKGYYNNIYLCSTTCYKDDKFKALVEELKEEDKVYDTFSDSICQEIMDKLENDVENGDKRNLLILDDCASLIPTSTEKNSSFNKLILGSRHYKVDIILTTQKFNKLNTLVRSNLDIISLFSTVNKKELQCYTDELNVNKEHFEDMLNQLVDKHEFLTISFISGKPVFYKNFDRIISS
jgi:energy-coupling factor transporter ATP-binding protein EcfA2